MKTQTFKRFAIAGLAVLASGVMSPKAQALDIVLELPRELINEAAGSPKIVAFPITKAVWSVLDVRRPVLSMISLVLLPFAVADGEATPADSMAKFELNLEKQGYSRQDIETIKLDLTQKIGPHFDGRTVTAQQFKDEVLALDLAPVTREALML